MKKRLTVILFMLLIVSALGCGREDEAVETAEPVRAFKITRKQEPPAPAVKPEEIGRQEAEPVTPPAVKVVKPAEKERPVPPAERETAPAKGAAPSETAAAPVKVKIPPREGAPVKVKPAPGDEAPVKEKPAPKVAVKAKPAPEVKPSVPAPPLAAVGLKRYDPAGRIDPFSPLFGEKVTVEAPAVRKVKTVREARQAMLTPLEKLDISQLTLVGIVRTPLRKLAMAEDVTGKGYVVKKGTYVGINSGRVVEILKNAVVIEEEVEDFMGKIVVRKRELKLQKPLGEE